jgi:WD40 repeat protein
VISVAFSIDNSKIVSGSVDKSVLIWRVTDGQIIKNLTGHTNDVNIYNP